LVEKISLDQVLFDQVLFDKAFRSFLADAQRHFREFLPGENWLEAT
jgi:hypothetical protein